MKTVKKSDADVPKEDLAAYKRAKTKLSSAFQHSVSFRNDLKDALTLVAAVKDKSARKELAEYLMYMKDNVAIVTNDLKKLVTLGK